MSHDYVPVQWNRSKIVYDSVLWLGIVLYLVLFIAVTMLTHTGAEALSPMIVLIRAFASCAFLMLTMILCIGPLARLDSRFLPLLYNRRHFGVSMFLVALVHGILVIVFYHSFGEGNPIVSIFASPGSYESISDFPFQPFGAVALFILMVMAATSHDYWNANLRAPVWKTLHMGVYLAYALLIVHVASGAMLQPETGLLQAMVYASLGCVGGLHLVAAFKRSNARRTVRIDGAAPAVSSDRTGQADDWVNVGAWQDIPDNQAITVTVGNDERVAIFRYDGTKLAAVSDVCEHQNGPLGEGRVIDGCITCPWHGFQYRPEDGRSPKPFTEKIATYHLKLEGDHVFLNPIALPKGSIRPVVIIGSEVAI